MNTVKSVWYGWGVLALAGGSAYYFAKREVNADRASKHQEWLAQRRLQAELEQQELLARTANAAKASPGGVPPDKDPASEAISKYESPVPFKSPRGNRFA